MVNVYKHTFPDGKVYIGIAENCEARWNNGRGYIENTKMYEAISDVGWENIKHEILISCETREKALSYESRFIVLHDSENPQKGYNRTNITSELYALEKSARAVNARRRIDADKKNRADELFREAVRDHVRFFKHPNSGDYIKLLLRLCAGIGLCEEKFVMPKEYRDTLDLIDSTLGRIWIFKKGGNNPTYYTAFKNVSLTPFDYAETDDALIIYNYKPERLSMILESIIAFNRFRNSELVYVGHGIMMLEEE